MVYALFFRWLHAKANKEGAEQKMISKVFCVEKTFDEWYFCDNCNQEWVVSYKTVFLFSKPLFSYSYWKGSRKELQARMNKK